MYLVRFFASFICGISSCLALAQDPIDLNGKWAAEFTSGKGVSMYADIVITGASGRWREFSLGRPGKNNPCLDREFPMTVDAKSSDEISFDIDASNTLQGCPNRHFVFKVIDSKTIEGSLGTDRSIRLTRK